LKNVIIIGGGLAGLVGSILLARKGLEVTLIEKKKYPFHRVCGEYLSYEVFDFLKRNGLYPEEVTLPRIDKFVLSSTNGKAASTKLDLGGIGVSRYYLDHHLYLIAKQEGVEIKEKTAARKISRIENQFAVELSDGAVLNTSLLVGAQGKKSNLDIQLNRKFIHANHDYIGVKYHIKTDFPNDVIALHNFSDGYCGMSMIEDDKYNLCYLTTRSNLKKCGDIPSLEAEVLQKNPYLKSVFNNSDFLFDQPEVINAFTFADKKPVENGVVMIGDAAGLITPLAGNGMAMAIHSAKVLADCIDDSKNSKDVDLQLLRNNYAKSWKNQFSFRLKVGRTTQKLFGSAALSNVAVGLLGRLPFLAKQIIKSTHGKPF
jgi:flavin-dependent dehydrogenase